MAAIRITPAYAGKSRFHFNTRDFFTGSPPPMRGKVILVCNLVAVFRITPAYAGKRHLHHRHLGDLQDHPRLCGEKHNHVPQLIFLYGSPPPMRGKVPDRGVNRFQIGITPAYAGKSNSEMM